MNEVNMGDIEEYTTVWLEKGCKNVDSYCYDS